MKAKTIIIILLIAATAFFGYKWYTSKKEDKKPEDNLQNHNPNKDTSAYADVAELTLNEALAKASERKRVYLLRLNTAKVDPTYRGSIYTVTFGERHPQYGTEVYYDISEATWNAMIDKGYEPDYE